MSGCSCDVCTCGCCEGVHLATPVPIFNRPGLGALAYRVGTHARFLGSMKARLSSRDHPALQGLRTREESDFSIALLDGWATVADVLTFYQERLANEGYLRTATERRSILELARLVGYSPRPGVAASVHLAFTVEAGHALTLPKGSGVQSVPGPGEKPQVFETSEDLEASAELSVLRPRLERPQYLTFDELARPSVVYLEGTATNVSLNDWLLLRFARKPEALFQVSAVTLQASANRTLLRVVRHDPPPDLKLIEDQPPERPKGPAIGEIVRRLRLPASLQPRKARLLERNIEGLFARASDLIPRLFGVLSPGIGTLIHRVLGQVATQGQAPLDSLDVLRVKAGLLGHNLPREVSIKDGVPTLGAEPTLDNTWRDSSVNKRRTLLLDAVYDQIQAGSWVVVKRPLLGKEARAHASWVYETAGVTDVETVSVLAHNVSSRVTRLDLDRDWLKERTPGENIEALYASARLLRGTTVFAQSEPLPLGKEPVAADVTGSEVELEGLHRGLEPGRFVIVEGERTDLLPPGFAPPDGSDGAAPAGGIVDAELAMISEVTHSLAKVPRAKLPRDHGDAPPPDLPGDTVHTFIRFEDGLKFAFKRDTVRIYANVVEATHGQTKIEVLGHGDATQAFQAFALKQPPLTYVAAPTARGAESTLEVRVNEVRWREAEHLAGLGPSDRRYQIHVEDDGKTTVVFGEGRRAGARLPTGFENVEARYRTGIGRDGNVGAGRITLLLSRPLGLKEVVNPIRAAGGADRESRDQARRNAPLPTRALDRLVSVPDYGDFARAFAGIGKASARELSDGKRQLVHVTVAGADDIPLSRTSDLFENLQRALRELGDPHQPLELAIRELLLLVVKARIRVAPDYAWDDVEPRVRAAMLTAFGFEARDLGQDVLQAEVLSVLQGVSGVAYADLDTLVALREGDLAASDPASVLDLRQRIPVSLAGFKPIAEQRASAPGESPIAPAQIAVLTPDVRDTLVLELL